MIYRKIKRYIFKCPTKMDGYCWIMIGEIGLCKENRLNVVRCYVPAVCHFCQIKTFLVKFCILCALYGNFNVLFSVTCPFKWWYLWLFPGLLHTVLVLVPVLVPVIVLVLHTTFNLCIAPVLWANKVSVPEKAYPVWILSCIY